MLSNSCHIVCRVDAWPVRNAVVMVDVADLYLVVDGMSLHEQNVYEGAPTVHLPRSDTVLTLPLTQLTPIH